MSDPQPQPGRDDGRTRSITLQGLTNRLRIKTPMVRKIAVMDMISRQQEFGVDAVAQVLLNHLPKETNPQLQVRIIEFLGQSGITKVIEPLQAMTCDNPSVNDAIHRAVESLRNQGRDGLFPRSSGPEL